jgi:hypothetical protein
MEVDSIQPRVRKKDQTFDLTKYFKIGLGVLAVVIIITQFFDVSIEPRFKISKKGSPNSITANQNDKAEIINTSSLEEAVLPIGGVTLPIKWGELGKKMITDGVISEDKFKKIFPKGFSQSEQAIFDGSYDQEIVMTKENSRFLLDMLWAFGLANKNDILENGEMTDPKYGGDASKFAATGGWSLAAGDPMNHYSAHSYVILTPEQQAMVDLVSRGIYRPCCGNSTHFPDCNHGMAMLGLLELMAANNVTEEEMYQVALLVNSYWFPQTYVDLALYFEEQGISWDQVDPKLVLGAEYSSAQGYSQTRQKIKSLPQPVSGGGSCGA